MNFFLFCIIDLGFDVCVAEHLQQIDRAGSGTKVGVKHQLKMVERERERDIGK